MDSSIDVSDGTGVARYQWEEQPQICYERVYLDILIHRFDLILIPVLKALKISRYIQGNLSGFL